MEARLKQQDQIINQHIADLKQSNAQELAKMKNETD
jgi:hypothetical protein